MDKEKELKTFKEKVQTLINDSSLSFAEIIVCLEDISMEYRGKLARLQKVIERYTNK